MFNQQGTHVSRLCGDMIRNLLLNYVYFGKLFLAKVKEKYFNVYGVARICA